MYEIKKDGNEETSCFVFSSPEFHWALRLPKFVRRMTPGSPWPVYDKTVTGKTQGVPQPKETTSNIASKQ